MEKLRELQNRINEQWKIRNAAAQEIELLSQEMETRLSKIGEAKLQDMGIKVGDIVTTHHRLHARRHTEATSIPMRIDKIWGFFDEETGAVEFNVYGRVIGKGGRALVRTITERMERIQKVVK
jgi:hypothetical protein